MGYDLVWGTFQHTSENCTCILFYSSSFQFDMPHDHVQNKKKFDHPRRQNKNPVQYVLYLLFVMFVRTHTKFGIKSLNEI